MKNKLTFVVSGLVMIYSLQGLSQNYLESETVTPPCLSGGQELNVNNAAVLQWKTSTQNQYRNRGHIQGVLVRDFPDHSGHHHYEVQIGGNPKDLIEVIYNEQFGPVPAAQPGAQFEACGDYITSTAQSGPYPASPDGAIIHWIHKSPNLKKHDSGYLIVNGVVCGQNSAGAGPKH